MKRIVMTTAALCFASVMFAYNPPMSVSDAPFRHPGRTRMRRTISNDPTRRYYISAAAPASLLLKTGRLGFHISRPPTSGSKLSGSPKGFIREASWIISVSPEHTSWRTTGGPMEQISASKATLPYIARVTIKST